MIYFLSSHHDTKFLQEFLGEEVTVIKHPYLNPSWTMDELSTHCKELITRAVEADKLIVNGDYSLVALIIIKRFMLFKTTGFVCFDKINTPECRKDHNGNIVYKNVLNPVGVRWT